MTLPGKRTTLYRHFDACGCLLYVGIAYDAKARSYSHKADSWWSRWSHRLDIQETYFDRTDAVAAEREAIRTERPVFNEVHAVDRQTFIVDYLIGHGRWEHLIVPGATTTSAKRDVAEILMRSGQRDLLSYVVPGAPMVRRRRTVSERLASCERNHPDVDPRWAKRGNGQWYCRECHRVRSRQLRGAQRTCNVGPLRADSV